MNVTEIVGGLRRVRRGLKVAGPISNTTAYLLIKQMFIEMNMKVSNSVRPDHLKESYRNELVSFIGRRGDLVLVGSLDDMKIYVCRRSEEYDFDLSIFAVYKGECFRWILGGYLDAPCKVVEQKADVQRDILVSFLDEALDRIRANWVYFNEPSVVKVEGKDYLKD